MAYEAVLQEEIMRKGPWLEEEDERLTTFVTLLGDRRWDFIARASGLRRSGKSCRLRWMNYLRPDLKHGRMSSEEEHIILQLHATWGNKWSRIARRLPGRTDSEVKNCWRTHLRRKTQVQEQENLQSAMDNATIAQPDYLVQDSDRSTTKSITIEHCGFDYKKETSGSSDESTDCSVFSDYAFASSPYEIRLSDWMSGFSDNQTVQQKQHAECNIWDSCFSSANDHNGIWDCSESLWDNTFK